MKTQTRKAVSPIIATLLLIAITVAAGVVVYVFVGGLSANLSKSGGNQVTEQISQDAYTSTVDATNSTIRLTLRNTGSASVTIASVYINGQALSQSVVGTLSLPAGSVAGNPKTLVLAQNGFTTGSIREFSWKTPITSIGSLSGGLGYQVKIVTLDGAIFTFNVIAGSSG